MKNYPAAARWLLLMWPLGLMLVGLAMEVSAVTTPVFVALDALYAATVVTLLRRLEAGRDKVAAGLVAIGTGIFAMVGFSGPPTADEPGLMMLNTAALFVIAIAIDLVGVQIILRHRSARAIASVVPAFVLLGVGTTVYLANLLARCAVFFAGASDQQAAVEDTAWVAFEYLRGIDGTPDFMSYLLVWLDLLQLGYVATVYLFFAAVARLLHSRDEIGGGSAQVVRLTGQVLTAMIVLGVTLAAALPHDLDVVPAWAAFLASIPFMTTLLPFLLGTAMLSHRATRSRRTTAQEVLVR